MTAIEWELLGAGLLLAFANGANDNTKGVASIYGAGRLGYPRATPRSLDERSFES